MQQVFSRDFTNKQALNDTKQLKNPRYKVKWHHKALLLFWKRGRIMDLFPVLGTVTHMVKCLYWGMFGIIFPSVANGMYRCLNMHLILECNIHYNILWLFLSGCFTSRLLITITHDCPRLRNYDCYKPQVSGSLVTFLSYITMKSANKY